MSVESPLYSTEFYKRQADLSYASAQIILPVVLGFMKVKSVVDFGCGVGTWLKAFQELGVERITGYEGNWVQGIEDKFFNDISVMDLNEAKPTGTQFDLAVSLEVAEHLKLESAENFVRTLCASAPVVLFSAAIPEQGGVDHINEQWQDYWAEHFLKNDYVPFDIIRPAIVNDKRIPWWYRQNMILFVKRGHEQLINAKPEQWTLNFIHPEAMRKKPKPAKKKKPKSLKKKIKSIAKKIFKR
jgi:hypothetical protein